MKFLRYEYQNEISSGVLSQGEVKKISGDYLGTWTYTGDSYSLDEVKLLAPISPNKIIGIGANFVQELGELPKEPADIPVFFFKPLTSVIGPNDEIIIPQGINEVKFESELVVVIGKKCKQIQADDVLDYVFGYTIGNDITAPQFFREDGHWTIGKAFDTFTPIGPFIETDIDLSTLYVKSEVNGIEKQNSSTNLMIISVKEMIAYLSNVMTLLPGDVVLTGSPIGAEFIGAGNIIECKIDEIGILQNKVINHR
ncbi:fumarylacetoacetate hydrolase family protein [Gracilibacillus sp. D59]|uniref:fumarylacetoacetate hydrolase family protein n=1 Tax=Gracilibacillus sp. D59 TaxID=3457434 RepID=UPI003FCD504E